MPTVNVSLTLTQRQVDRLQTLRTYYNTAEATDLSVDEFATLLVRESAIERWKAYHNDFATVLEAYATASGADQASVDAILGLIP